MKTTLWSLTGAALLLALMTASVRADEAEDNAVEAIEDLGGRITRDMKAQDKPIVRVYLAHSKVTDGGLKHPTGFEQLRATPFSLNSFPDAGQSPGTPARSKASPQHFRRRSIST
jgi:hypothetical protein